MHIHWGTILWYVFAWSWFVIPIAYGWWHLRRHPDERRNLPNYFGEDARGP